MQPQSGGLIGIDAGGVTAGGVDQGLVALVVFVREPGRGVTAVVALTLEEAKLFVGEVFFATDGYVGNLDTLDRCGVEADLVEASTGLPAGLALDEGGVEE